MKLKPQTRFMKTERVDADARVVALSFSSETPVERYWGKEVLSHDPKAARLDRLNAGGPLLFNHNLDDVVGVVERAWIDKGRGYADVRFPAPGTSARADEVFGLVRDGILRNVSFMYRINQVVEDKKSETFTVTDWEAMEVSIVTVPADQSVGVGRTAPLDEIEVRVCSTEATAVAARAAEIPPAAPAANPKEVEMTEATAAAGASAEAVNPERLRIKAITALARQHKIDDAQRDAWIDSGADLDQVTGKILDVIAERGSKNPQSEAKLDLSKGDLGRYSMLRAIEACASQNWSKAGFEAECSKEIAQRMGKSPDPRRFLVPFDVLQRSVATGKRDLGVTPMSAGGALVQTENVGFVELLRNRSVLYAMGARRLSGLTGNVTIPRHTAAATAFWLGSETTPATESQQTFGQIALTPKNVAAYTEISRQLALQSSPDAESLVMADLAAIVAIEVDRAGLAGSGAAGQPTGIINTAGIGSVTGTTIGYAGMLEFQTDTATSNALFDSAGYVATPGVASILMQRVKFASTASPLWDGNLLNGNACGFRAMSSNQLPASNLLFGAFDQVVVAEWGVLEVEVNPYANFAAGIIGVRAFYSTDIGVRYPAAFSLSTNVT
jgi:HK97 family phage major capsid protein/HK97 family phage prohead protease